MLMEGIINIEHVVLEVPTLKAQLNVRCSVPTDQVQVNFNTVPTYRGINIEYLVLEVPTLRAEG